MAPFSLRLLERAPPWCNSRRNHWINTCSTPGFLQSNKRGWYLQRLVDSILEDDRFRVCPVASCGGRRIAVSIDATELYERRPERAWNTVGYDRFCVVCAVCGLARGVDWWGISVGEPNRAGGGGSDAVVYVDVDADGTAGDEVDYDDSGEWGRR